MQRRPVVLACVMLALFMSAVEVTIVATALPQIVGRLGGFALYTWVFSGFLLTQTATILVFGKLADLYGRRPVLIGGMVVFLVGSVLCGLAWSMPALIVFRLLYLLIPFAFALIVVLLFEKTQLGRKDLE